MRVERINLAEASQFRSGDFDWETVTGNASKTLGSLTNTARRRALIVIGGATPRSAAYARLWRSELAPSGGEVVVALPGETNVPGLLLPGQNVDAIMEIADVPRFRRHSGIRAVPFVLVLDHNHRIQLAAGGFLQPTEITGLLSAVNGNGQGPVLFRGVRDVQRLQ